MENISRESGMTKASTSISPNIIFENLSVYQGTQYVTKLSIGYTKGKNDRSINRQKQTPRSGNGFFPSKKWQLPEPMEILQPKLAKNP
jgi:hypothetical protein